MAQQGAIMKPCKPYGCFHHGLCYQLCYDKHHHENREPIRGTKTMRPA